MISIKINGEVREVPAEIDLDRLLELFSLPRQRIAIERNDGVVSRAEWNLTVIKEGDKIEVIHFVGGG